MRNRKMVSSLMRSLGQPFYSSLVVIATGVCILRSQLASSSHATFGVFWIGLASVFSYFVCHSLIEVVKPAMLKSDLWGRVSGSFVFLCPVCWSDFVWAELQVLKGSVKNFRRKSTRRVGNRSGTHFGRDHHFVPPMVSFDESVQCRHHCNYIDCVDWIHG